ncbi:MAG: hypothetical protein ABS948_11455 [Solibacillus sp.]
MMSFVKPNAWQNIWQQFCWKLSIFSPVIYSIILIQALFTLLTFDGSGMRGGGNGVVSVYEKFYSLDFLLITGVMAFLLIGWQLATKKMVDENFTIVTTRLTAHASTSLFLVFLSAFSTITALSSLYILVALRGLIGKAEILMPLMPFHLNSTVVFFLVMLMAGAGGYLLGSLVYTSKLNIVALIVIAFFFVRNYVENVETLFNFYVKGTMLSFSMKALATTLILYAIAIFMKNRKEVRGG